MANRLEYEDSTYLQKLKETSVDWWPWCDEAFVKAEKENKAIFISIGYDSCHWCQVMDQEVFGNEECAEILNDGFVCIKVDTQERPDIDKYYQEVYKLLNNKTGGWPNSIFSTPDNKPFFARTYLPVESTPGSNEGMGFKELISIIAEKVKEGDQKLYDTAEEVDEFLKKVEHPAEATRLSEEFRKNFMLQAKQNYDTLNGGFSSEPKFPHVSKLYALLTIDRLYDDSEARSILQHTLNSMQKEGIHDLKNGAFYRYTEDKAWSIPHLEKTIYDNALLIDIYTQAYITYKDESYLQTAKACADFWHNSMSEDDLFYTATHPNSLNKSIQTAYSGMMIHSLFKLGAIDEKYKQRAIKNLDALMMKSYLNGQLYHTTLIGKTPKVKAFLEDYAFLAKAFISAFEESADELYLINAQRFSNKALELFYDKGVWSFSTGALQAKADPTDNTYTSSVSVMVDNLLSLGTLLKDDKYTHFAFKTMEYNSYELARKPIYMPYMLTQTLRYLRLKSF